MKQILQSLAFSLLLVSSTSLVTGQSSTIGKATISSEMVITLDESSPLIADYVFDISGISFKNKEAAERYFNLSQDNILKYSVNYDTKLATVHIMIEHMAPRGWDVAKYNEYLGKVSERYRNNLMVVNE